MKQLKYGKFLDIIWTAKVELRKVHMAEMDWYMAKYANRQNESNAEELSLKESVLELTFNGLLDSFHKLDQIVVKDQFLWANYGSFFKIKWVEIKWHMDASTHEEDLHNMELVHLNSSFSDGYNDLMQQLEELEVHFSK
ncbi:hypothetical protein GNP82_20505 [Aliivibrio fischeri]|uniref:hypothetical protein n=1 Tax=Aliivibrio fischeri TaxID=668 RepID=UPI0012D92237|nr:hypothetical protein [Aliivibrio fischeri]MUK39917.1 hypothetical protein [Aliivibrio fischeri]MUL08120.1 hypothetical protein [Aliivibrio fischeri]